MDPAPLDLARAVADAVLYEGYVLYPYRASAQKNRLRWQWGVLVPRDQHELAGEPWATQADLLVEGDATVRVVARGLQLQTNAEGWDEGVEREIVVDGARTEPFLFSATNKVQGQMTVSATPQPGPYGVTKIRVRVENLTPWRDQSATRDEVMRRSLVSVHVLATVSGGRFLSLIDPPEWARPYVETCEQVGLWPVLAGEGDDVMLAPPIIIEERPRIAPESAGDMFDGTEMDEMLTLRTLTLTDEEKAEARATDRRAAAVIDRVDSTSPEALTSLHGVAVREGMRVRLAPEPGGDVQDMFLGGQTATVEAILVDVDGATHVAVTLDDDPGADLFRAEGRFRYFRPDEVTPL